MADNMADGLMADRRDWGSGSIYQRQSDGRWLGTIEAGFTASGTRRRITVTGKTEAIVKRKLRDKRRQIELTGQATGRGTTVAKFAAQWLEDIRPHVRPTAWTTDAAGVRYIVATIGHKRFADLTPRDVTSVAGAIRKAGKSSSTALRYHGTLMRLLKAASIEGHQVAPNLLLSANPKAAVSDREQIPLADVVRLFTQIRSRTDGSRWTVAFLTGLRQAEALGLTWEQVDLDAGTLTVAWQAKGLRCIVPRDPSQGFHVPDGYEARQIAGAKHLVRPKSKAGWRVVPLIGWAQTALEEWREIAPENRHGLVWPGADGWPRNEANDRAEWAAIQGAAEVRHKNGRPYTTHEIRHTTATLLMELKVPESVRVQIMGHSSMNSTKAYEHVDTAQARLALEGVGRLLDLG